MSSFPTANTNLYGPDVPVNIPVPSPGSFNYFFNQNDGNQIWYKNSDAQFFAYNSGQCDPCLCKSASETLCAWNQALLEGTLDQTAYSALVTAGIAISCDNDGVTNTIRIGLPT